MENSRIDRLEKEITDLKAQLKGDKSKKEKKPRAPSDYNTFMKTYIAEQKTKLGANYDHKAVFKDAADTWSKKKQSR